VDQAAKRLGISESAVRQRIHRGTIESEKDENGRLVVYLTADDTQDNGDTTPVVQDYIDALKSQIEAVENDRDEWREEARRKDHIIMALTQRIPELEAAPEPQESAVIDSESDVKGDVPREPAADEISKSWWQRLFGG